MLIYCILQEISAQWQKRGFAIAYKSSSYMPDLAALPWARGSAELISASLRLRIPLLLI
ncbi:MAG: hypothetical protein R8K46_10590 [Mariprofundaceae bacterium]